MYKGRGFMKDMNRSDLLKMREGGMSNKAIAKSLGCSYNTVLELIGKQPKDITSASCRVGQLASRMPSEGGVYRGNQDEEIYAAA
jgi:hypothetical protein